MPFLKLNKKRFTNNIEIFYTEDKKDHFLGLISDDYEILDEKFDIKFRISHSLKNLCCGCTDRVFYIYRDE